MTGILPKLTLDYIESKLDQIDIFAYYLNISTSEIMACIGSNYTICSPLREDKHPTCGFYYQSGKLRFNDFAGYFHGDCYDVVGYRNLLNARDKVDFAKILDIIARDFGIWKYENGNNRDKDTYVRAAGKDKQKVIIDVQFRNYGFEDHAYWTPYHIDQQQLIKFKTYPLYSYWINGQLKYSHSFDDLCYGYYEGKDQDGIDLWQLYHPYRTKVRFLTNYAGIRARHNIKKSEFGVLTKSIKDVMVLDLFGINSVSLAAEGIPVRANEDEKISKYWSKKYCLTDYDRTGIRAAWRLRKQGYEPLFLTNGQRHTWNYGAKDISEFIALYGYNKTKDWIDYILEEPELNSDYYDFLTLKHIGSGTI